MTTQPAPRELLDVAGAADYLATSERHVRFLVHKREIPHTRVGRFLRFLPRDLDQYLEARAVKP